MAVTGVTANPQVEKLGGAWEERYAYPEDEVFAAGDLIRLSDAGTIQMADTTGAGSVQGMALETGVDSSAEAMPVLMFAPDTIIKIQTIDAESPADLTKGLAYTLDVTSGSQAISATATGVAIVVDYAATGQPFTDRTGSFDETAATDNNSVLIRFSAATLDARITAA